MKVSLKRFAICGVAGAVATIATAPLPAQPPSGPSAEAGQFVGRRFDETAPKLGEKMPNVKLFDSNGGEVWLHDVLIGHRTVLLLGCLT